MRCRLWHRAIRPHFVSNAGLFLRSRQLELLAFCRPTGTFHFTAHTRTRAAPEMRRVAPAAAALIVLIFASIALVATTTTDNESGEAPGLIGAPLGSRAEEEIDVRAHRGRVYHIDHICEVRVALPSRDLPVVSYERGFWVPHHFVSFLCIELSNICRQVTCIYVFRVGSSFQ